MGAKQNIGRTTNSTISAPFVELHQALTSRATAISPFLDQLMQFIRLVGAGRDPTLNARAPEKSA